VGKESAPHPYGASSCNQEMASYPYGDPSGGKIQLFGKGEIRDAGYRMLDNGET